MIKTEYKAIKIKHDGMNKIVPMRRNSILGFGVWKIDPDWEEEEKRLAEEQFLGLDTDSTLTQVRKFIDKRDITNIKNGFYHD